MFDLSRWPYIKTIAFTGHIKTDMENLLIANEKQNTATHCIAVATLSADIASRLDMDETAVWAAALLHDISVVIKPVDMLNYAIDHDWMLDAAELSYPFLLHQRLSAVIAQKLFGVVDAGALSAIGCHTTLKSNPSTYDMIVFLADKLSWDQTGKPPYNELVSAALNVSIESASLAYIRYVLDNSMLLHPHAWLLEAKKWLEKNR